MEQCSSLTAEPRVSAEADAEVGGGFESTSESFSFEAVQIKLFQLEAIELESLSPAAEVHPKHSKHSISKTIVMGCCVEESRGCTCEKFEIKVGV